MKLIIRIGVLTNDKASRERVVTYTFILEESLLGACGSVNRDRREEEIGRLLGA